MEDVRIIKKERNRGIYLKAVIGYLHTKKKHRQL
jgi:hypothetical protein